MTARSGKKHESDEKSGKLIRIFNIIFGGKKINNLKGKFENLTDSVQNTPYTSEDKSSVDENYVFDIRSNYWRSNTVTENYAQGTMQPSPNNVSKKPMKISVKPIDVLEQVIRPPRDLDLLNLDDKIFLLEEKLEFIRSRYSKSEIEGLISCLKNRKKYDVFFSQFQTTDIDHLDKLLETHDLVIKDADLFVPEFPKEAIKIMKEYTNKVKEVTGGKKPVFYVIATSDDFKKVERKRDPILLAQSPFGFYYDILGAWDKEMLLLSEL